MLTVYKVLLILHSEVPPVVVQGCVKNVHATTRRSDDHRSSKCQRGGWVTNVLKVCFVRNLAPFKTHSFHL